MSRRWPLILSCVVGVTVFACSSEETARPPSNGVSVLPGGGTIDVSPTEEAGPPSEAVSRLIEDALRTEGDLSYEELLQRLGPPAETETQTVANKYVENQTDTLRTLIYTGVQALVYDVTDDSKSFLVRLSISSTQYGSPEGIRVGMSTDRVRDELGPPTRRNRSRGELIYQETGPTPISMVVRLEEERVVEIGWEFYFA